jgi:TorA maturation chaperone TorD
MATIRENMAETASARSNVYGFLAHVYRMEPDEALIREIRKPDFSKVLAGIGVALGDEFQDSPPDQLAEDLAIEYTRLFIGPGPRISPHESLHVESHDAAENDFWGPQTVKVKRFIEATGLDYGEDFSGLPDHISAEFELMQKLADRESQSWSEGEENAASWCQNVQKRFFTEHLIKWVPEFCDKVVENANLRFFSQMAAVTKDFMELERENLADRGSKDVLN